MKKLIFIIVLPYTIVDAMNNIFWTQDRPLVGLPPLPTQWYKPPSNPIRCCASNSGCSNCCTYVPCNKTILDYNYICNCFDDCNPVNPVWTEAPSSSASRRDIINNIRSCSTTRKARKNTGSF